MLVDVGSVDADRLAVLLGGDIGSAEGNLLQQALEQRVQATRTDVLGLFVDLPGDLGDAFDAIFEEFDVQAFGLQQLAVLLGERRVRLGEDALEVFR